MGILHRETLPLPDLKVTLEDTFFVFPSQETERKSMFLSNIDQVLNFNVQTLHFFPAHPEFPPAVVVRKLRNALSEMLVPYSYLAGRLSLNKELGRLEIDCNAAGVGFVVASSQHSLDEIGDLVYPNPAFRQLVVHPLEKLGQQDQPLCIFQVTTFRCGGFAMGISTNHCTFDGLSFKTFLQNLAAKAADKPLPIPPCNDRHLLAARSPPQVTFPHAELLKLEHPISQYQAPPTSFYCPEDGLEFQIFRLSSGDISSMKEKAKGSATGVKVTGFNVVTAHLWRCKALSRDPGNLDRESTVRYAVDIRPRLVPALPMSYAGNAVLTAYATATCRELEEGPLGRLVERVAGGAEKITDEYARSAIDWGETCKAFPHGELLISSWWRLGFGEVEYPWGKPRYSCPVVYHRKDIILLFPAIDDDGVNVLVALPPKEMELFKTFFHKFLLLEN